MADIAAIRARLSAATPGPWRWAAELMNGYRLLETVWTKDCGLFPEESDRTGYFLTQTILMVEHEEGENEEGDYPFIAHAPEDIAQLLTIAERAQALLERFRDAQGLLGVEWKGEEDEFRGLLLGLAEALKGDG